VKRSNPPLALAILVMALCAGTVQAGTVTIVDASLTLHDPWLAEDLAALDRPGDLFDELALFDAGLIGSTTTTGGMALPDPAPETEPQAEQPAPPQPLLAGPALLPSQTMTGGSMSNTSVTSAGGSSSTIPPADLQITPQLLLATSGELLANSDWLFIPPRFLDGVFRPPRRVVSL